MCSPMFLFAGLAAMQVGMGIQQGKAYDQIGKYNQQVAENNARYARQQAEDERKLGAQEVQKAEWRKRATLGLQRVSAASANVDLSQGFGSGLDILDDTALLAGAEKNTIMLDAMRRAWGFDVQASNYKAQGQLERYQGKVQKQASFLGGLAQGLGTIAGSNSFFLGSKPGPG